MREIYVLDYMHCGSVLWSNAEHCIDAYIMGGKIETMQSF